MTAAQWPLSESLGVGRWMLNVGRFLFLLTDILCRSIESHAHNLRLRRGKINIRVALPAPGTG
jgi:hypothetical protein